MNDYVTATELKKRYVILDEWCKENKVFEKMKKRREEIEDDIRKIAERALILLTEK